MLVRMMRVVVLIGCRILTFYSRKGTTMFTTSAQLTDALIMKDLQVLLFHKQNSESKMSQTNRILHNFLNAQSVSQKLKLKSSILALTQNQRTNQHLRRQYHSMRLQKSFQEFMEGLNYMPQSIQPKQFNKCLNSFVNLINISQTLKKKRNITLQQWKINAIRKNRSFKSILLHPLLKLQQVSRHIRNKLLQFSFKAMKIQLQKKNRLNNISRILKKSIKQYFQKIKKFNINLKKTYLMKCFIEKTSQIIKNIILDNYLKQAFCKIKQFSQSKQIPLSKKLILCFLFAFKIGQKTFLNQSFKLIKSFSNLKSKKVPRYIYKYIKKLQIRRIKGFFLLWMQNSIYRTNALKIGLRGKLVMICQKYSNKCLIYWLRRWRIRSEKDLFICKLKNLILYSKIHLWNFMIRAKCQLVEKKEQKKVRQRRRQIMTIIKNEVNNKLRSAFVQIRLKNKQTKYLSVTINTFYFSRYIQINKRQIINGLIYFGKNINKIKVLKNMFIKQLKIAITKAFRLIKFSLQQNNFKSNLKNCINWKLNQIKLKENRTYKLQMMKQQKKQNEKTKQNENQICRKNSIINSLNSFSLIFCKRQKRILFQFFKLIQLIYFNQYRAKKKLNLKLIPIYKITQIHYKFILFQFNIFFSISKQIFFKKYNSLFKLVRYYNEKIKSLKKQFILKINLCQPKKYLLFPILIHITLLKIFKRKFIRSLKSKLKKYLLFDKIKTIFKKRYSSIFKLINGSDTVLEFQQRLINIKSKMKLKYLLCSLYSLKSLISNSHKINYLKKLQDKRSRAFIKLFENSKKNYYNQFKSLSKLTKLINHLLKRVLRRIANPQTMRLANCYFCEIQI